MLGDSELDELSGKYNKFKTTLSGATAKNFSEYVNINTPDLNKAKDFLSGNFDINNSDFDADKIINDALSKFSSMFSGIGSVKIKTDQSNINGGDDGCGDDILCSLLKIIMGIIEIPKRFSYMSLALMEGTGSLVMGIEGLGKSIALAAEDIYKLFIAICTIVFKYSLCILSFILTTIAGCFFIHPITLIVVIIYLGVMGVFDKIRDNYGYDFSQQIDQAFEYIQWPKEIQLYCYSCFGEVVKVRDVLTDVGVLTDIGDMISYDFNIRMPNYMKPAKPLGKLAQKHLNIAVN